MIADGGDLKRVSMASQPAGAPGKFGLTLFVVATAIDSAAAANRGLRTSHDGHSVTATRPSHAVPGNRSPADVRGEAHPITASGGTAEAVKASGIRQRSWLWLVVQVNPPGAASRQVASSHNARMSDAEPFAPKKCFAAVPSGQEAVK